MPSEPAANPILQFPIIPYILIILIFYFLVIKPQREKQKQQKEMLSGIKKNDQVITASGIHGTVVNVKDTTVIIRIDDAAKMEVDKEAITTIKTNMDK